MVGAEGTVRTCGNRGSDVMSNLPKVTKSMPSQCLLALESMWSVGRHQEVLRHMGALCLIPPSQPACKMGKTGIALAPISQICKLRPDQAKLLTQDNPANQ